MKLENIFKGIIWDLDGTLYDPFVPGLEALETCFQKACEKGIITGERKQRLMRRINGEPLYSYRFWKKIYEEDSKLKGGEEFPLSLVFKKAWFDESEWSEDTCKYLERVWQKGFYSGIFPFPWVHTTMNRLEEKGAAMGIISDSPVRFGELKLRALELEGYFSPQNIIWTKETGRKKPDKQPFLRMCNLLGAYPYEILVIGDVYHKDGIGARNAGMSYLPLTYKTDTNFFLEQLWRFMEDNAI